MSMGQAIREELESLVNWLKDKALKHYQNKDIENARVEVNTCLSNTLYNFERMFGFPDSYGMDAMIQGVLAAAKFMIECSDKEGAKELLGRPWAFGIPKDDIENLFVD